MEKTAVLLVNLGTPNSPETASVRTYLAQFLSDRRVIDIPRWRWLPVLHGIILRVRPKKSAKLYKSIWTESGSPLLVHSQKQCEALQERFAGEEIKVEIAMNYGNPSLQSQLAKLHAWGMRKLIILPLFPQYSSTTTASIWDHVCQSMKTWRDIPEICFIRDFPDHPLFVALLAKKIQACLDQHGQPDAIVLSYHGIPQRYADTGDDYPSRCRLTTNALQKQFPQLDIMESFQSKFGKEPWIEPATNKTLQKLATEGKTHIHIMAPAFTAECLETLEELCEENKALFMNSGGKKYHYIPAANDDPLFIDCLEALVRQYV